jgi:hypothetical protein
MLEYNRLGIKVCTIRAPAPTKLEITKTKKQNETNHERNSSHLDVPKAIIVVGTVATIGI